MEHVLKGNGKVKSNKGTELTGDFFVEGILEEIWDKRQNFLYLNIKENLLNDHLNDLPLFPWDFEGENPEGGKHKGKLYGLN
ncbi:hypothetical protein F6Y02_41545 (plasmid) [Bacillus megaterium]|nr:hypothetical protein [Priestia megaterium]NGY80541.1 hypothetical protein [Priestia megaterium]